MKISFDALALAPAVVAPRVPVSPLEHLHLVRRPCVRVCLLRLLVLSPLLLPDPEAPEAPAEHRRTPAGAVCGGGVRVGTVRLVDALDSLDGLCTGGG